MARRFRKMQAAIRLMIVKNDVLGLKAQAIEERMQAVMFVRAFSAPLLDATPLPKKAFQFISPVDRVSAVTDWFYQLAQEEVLGVVPGTRSQVATSSTTWPSRYIRTAARKGRADARAKIAKRRTFDAKRRREPLPTDTRVALIEARTYTELEGITDEMARRLTRNLSHGIAEGLHPNRIARDIADDIDISLTRARTLARTEIISAHSEASLNEYEESGIEGVEIEAEFTTSGDDAVCPECEELEGEVFAIEEARGMIPVHPNCRCAFLPVMGDREELDL